MTKDAKYYETRIQALEHELEDMTVALSHAWDQLVPFLQDIPSQTETAQDIEPILYTVAAAADAEIAGIYLFKTKQWYSVPEPFSPSAELLQRFPSITKEQSIEFVAGDGRQVFAVFAPVISESQVIGVLGAGTYNPHRSFTVVDLRVIKRTAERIGQQIAAAQLAHFREREALRLHELQIANDIQQSVQPENAPLDQRIQMASYWKPAKLVGGDAWGWVQLSDDRVSWFILDVAGKGLPASLAAVALHTAI
ncbi:MAG: hypothetical protein JNJ61_26230, partial [Anaerolineae bacterium]|nr:hypothetical protein [Anaerolineae bacterium]